MIFQILNAILILIIAIIFLNPGHLSMPDNMHTMLILGLIIAFLSFAALILKEKAHDEREASHIHFASRSSYLVGVATLIAALISQSLSQEIDPWLILCLSIMILSKLLARIYAHFRM